MKDEEEDNGRSKIIMSGRGKSHSIVILFNNLKVPRSYACSVTVSGRETGLG